MSENGTHGGADEPRDPRLERLYRDAARELPPAHLDAAILAAARREVGAGPRRLGPFSASRWRLPVALAAVVVLSVSLVTVMMDEGGEEVSAPPRPAAGDAYRPQAPAALPPAAGRAGERQEQVPATPPAAPAAAPESREAAARERKLERVRPMPESDFSAPPAAPALRAAPEPAAEAAAQSRADAPTAIAPAEPKAKRSAAPERDAQFAPRPQAKPAPMPDSSGGLGSMQREALSDEMTSSSPARPVPDVSALIKALDGEPPEQWLARIAELRREGRTAAAEALLAEFRRRFPSHPGNGR